MALRDLRTEEQVVINVEPFTRITIPPRVAHELRFDSEMILEIASSEEFSESSKDFFLEDMEEVFTEE
jgi:hypothetical protein